MTKNKIRGAPKKKSNRVRDSDISKQVKADIKNLIKKVVNYISSNKIKLIPYVLIAFAGNRLSYGYRCSNANDFMGRVNDMINSFNKILEWPLLSLNIRDVIAGIVTALAVMLVLYVKMMDAKNYRKGEEYGSASFGTSKDIENFIAWDNPYNNLLLSDTERLSMNPRMPDPTTNRNKNVLIVGGSGSGKTRGHVKPNICQLFGSYIITDPKGGVIYETGYLLSKAGYKISVLNTINFTVVSKGYNVDQLN